MTSLSPRRSLVAAGACAALTLAGLSAATLGGPASAVSGELSYNCTNPDTGPFVATAVIDTDAPATLGTGVTVAIATSTSVVVPDATVTTLRDAGIGYVQGTAAANGTVDGVNRVSTLIIPHTDVPDAGSMTLAGSGPSGNITGGAVGSTILLGAGAFDVTLNAYTDAGVFLATETVNCVLQDAQNTLVDSVSVVQAPTTTTVTVQNAPVQYGDIPTVTAEVTAAGANGKPSGKIDFTYGGKTVTADVKAGKAKAFLPAALQMGTNSVHAVFTPTNPKLAGSQTTKSFKVVKAASTSTVTAVYRPFKDKIVARDKVVAAFETGVEGSVRFVVKRDGVRIRVKTVALNQFDVAKARFGSVVKKGTYVVIARYLGSSTLKRSTDRVQLTV